MTGCGLSRNTGNCCSSGKWDRTVATLVAADLKRMNVAEDRNCFEIKCISKQFFIFAAEFTRDGNLSLTKLQNMSTLRFKMVDVNTEIQNGRDGFREEAA